MAGPFLCAFCKAKSSKKHAECAAPKGAKLSAKVSKGFKWVVRMCYLCALIRGLQNLESSFIKGFNCCGAKLRLWCAASRFAEPRYSLQRERIVTFCVVQKVTKKHTGRSPATSIQSSAGEDFSKAFRQHKPKPVFRTKRRRKGFESVRDSGFTA